MYWGLLLPSLCWTSSWLPGLHYCQLSLEILFWQRGRTKLSPIAWFCWASAWWRGLTPCWPEAPPAKPCGSSHWHAGGVPSPHLSTQRTLKQDCDTGRMLLLLIFQVLQVSCMHQGNRIFSAACPDLTGSKHEMQSIRWSPHRPQPSSLGSGHPAHLFPSPSSSARARPTQMKEAFLLLMAD